jgi:hypothetical protein
VVEASKLSSCKQRYESHHLLRKFATSSTHRPVRPFDLALSLHRDIVEVFDQPDHDESFSFRIQLFGRRFVGVARRDADCSRDGLRTSEYTPESHRSEIVPARSFSGRGSCIDSGNVRP